MTVTETIREPHTRTLAPRRTSRKLRVRRGLTAALIALILCVEIYPLFWVLMGSLKTQNDWLNRASWKLPASWDFTNYSDAFTTGHLGTYIRNSVITVLPALAVTLLCGLAAGFALEVLVWKGRSPVLLLFLAGIMVPIQMTLLPLFTIYFKLGLTGTLWPLFITYSAVGLPLTVFMMATYFRAVPRELFEAATLDGAGVFRSFWHIGVPLVRNALFTVGLVQFFFIWNDLLLALTFANDKDHYTIQAGLLAFQGQYGAVQYGPTFAAISVNVFGTLLIYLFLNQRVMKGLTEGGLKG